MTPSDAVCYAYLFSDPEHPGCWRALGYNGRKLCYSLLTDKQYELPGAGEIGPEETWAHAMERLKKHGFETVFESLPPEGLPQEFSAGPEGLPTR